MKKIISFKIFFVMSVMFLTSCQTVTTKAPGPYALPAEARVIIDRSGCEKGAAPYETDDPYTLTEAEVRQIFASYRLITQQEMHYNYLWSPCYVRGTIELNQKVYSWYARRGNTLETNYPKGDVVLGGEASDAVDGSGE